MRSPLSQSNQRVRAKFRHKARDINHSSQSLISSAVTSGTGRNSREATHIRGNLALTRHVETKR